jgi:pilus assembly protein Flp/PilA
MNKLMRLLSAAQRSERGATATEYGLLVGFIAMVIVSGVALFGTAVDAWFAAFAATLAAIL